MRFDRYGLLTLGNVHFLLDGTLAATVRRLVCESPDGCTQKELQDRGPQANFDFLGFTRVWGRSRRGNGVVRQFTANKRMARSLKAVTEWC